MEKTATKTSAFRYSRIEPADYQKLIQSIDEILCEGNSHNAGKYDLNHWYWQYLKLPSAKAFIYGVFDENDLLIGYYHIPCYTGHIGEKKVLIGMIQDVAISQKSRGGGVFRQLAQYAHQDIAQEVDFIYTFPNHKSIHTFIKYNQYSLLKTLPAYILPINAAKIIHSKLKIPLINHLATPFTFLHQKICQVNVPKDYQFIFDHSLNLETEQLLKSFNALHRIGLDKNNQYIQWRFFDKPNSKHYLLKVIQNQKLLAILVFKVDEMLGNPSLLLMDFAYIETENHVLMALQWLKDVGLSQIPESVNLLFTSGNSLIFNSLYKVGFVKIPNQFSPRPLNLLTKNIRLTDCANAIFDSNNWLITLADWDVF
ncbi:MAG: GNAT family N-acetyltransferase [Bacteroidia bacterium]|nr:GNAT family N-acetyltransferase [Bacteroidia bacterium]